ncbi:hypothetical protein M5D96_005570 [Drosophila gunungcola]|uniref:Uncharacterized protein n=1 Tax=Drosophila gunungcola TaxID=103775 RepID=A0A9P9YLE3_9MUSC|nr:hypothetical protein M5D96_007831 [Drosophila gunungcola]KAI8041313.1 hypothetical protein M5D96_005570 [Drosophila gunungcola]
MDRWTMKLSAGHDLAEAIQLQISRVILQRRRRWLKTYK